MLLAAFLLAFVVPIQYVWALNITFPSPPTAAQNNTFLWMRENGDPGKIWLRKQKLDDDHGATSWSGDSDSAQLDLTISTGSAQIHFHRAGLFNVGVFKMEDNSNHNKGMAPVSVKQLTVSVNPTSAGAISGTSPTPPPVSASSPVGSSSPNQMPSHEKYEGKTPNVALIVGLTLGFATLLVIAGATILYFRCRYRRMSDAMPIPFQNNRMIRESDSESCASFEKCDSPPPIQTLYSVPTSGSFSVTSPIAAATRERERRRNKFLRFSFTTINSSTNSRSTITSNSRTTDSSESPLPPVPARPRTDRQMLIEQKIQLLQSKMIILQGRSKTTSQIYVRPLPPLPPASPGSPSRLPTTPIPLTPLPTSDEKKELKRLTETVERTKQLHESDWALGLTDLAPEGLHD
ncbi:hypothetical protein E1B28_013057 [Marasmius oreades]|uniref:Uncharacterized protein n=1 Tax=Marasmius oreades TaxID=181124 RepID=A0A9P7RP47_9AGAR|nr:uncharacterized protein E1B28_013057 [Marasmius oreades]KAG7087075.1 hypothetical protein E1B28_013057 [Marasmius oreades]